MVNESLTIGNFWHKKSPWITIKILGGNLFNLEYFENQLQILYGIFFNHFLFLVNKFQSEMKYIWKYDFFKLLIVLLNADTRDLCEVSK